MSEDVRTAGESIPKRRSASPIHSVRCHNAEVQLSRHLEKHVELIHLRAVFRRGDVKLDQALNGLFAGFLTDAQMSRLSAARSNAARLQTHAIEPAMFRAGRSKPVRRQSILDSTRKQQVSQRTLDAEFVESFLLLLSAVVAKLCRCLSNFASLAGCFRVSAIQHNLGGSVVSVHVRRRKRELGTDPFEAVPQSILIQFPGHRRIVAHTEQIIDRVLVLFAAQPIVRHGGPRRHSHRAAFAKPCIEIRHERRDFILTWLRLRLWRHLTAVHLIDRLRPVMSICAQTKVTRQLINSNIAFDFFRTMTPDAMSRQEFFKRLLCENDTGPREPCDHRHHGVVQ